MGDNSPKSLGTPRSIAREVVVRPVPARLWAKPLGRSRRDLPATRLLRRCWLYTLDIVLLGSYLPIVLLFGTRFGATALQGALNACIVLIESGLVVDALVTLLCVFFPRVQMYILVLHTNSIISVSSCEPRLPTEVHLSSSTQDPTLSF